MDVVAQLRRLAHEQFATSPAELKRFAKARGLAFTGKDVTEALKTNVAHQILAPKQKFASVSAAERPGGRIQADLAEFPVTKNNPNPRYESALVATDVFTRQTYAEPLRTKSKVEVSQAMRKVLQKMPGHGNGAAVSTDSGGEFRGVDAIMKARGGVHRLKVGRNDIAVVDRSLQTLKVKLANALANHGGAWDKNLGKVVKSYNDNPRAVVHGPPATAGQPDTVQNFVTLQDNANKFVHNFEVSRKREQEVYAAGAVRPAIEDGSRGHKPRYGKVAQIESLEDGGLHAIDTNGNKILLKTALVTARESAEPKNLFGTQATRPKRPTFEEVRARLRRFRAMHGPIPAAASRVFEPSAPSGVAHEPAASLLNPAPSAPSGIAHAPAASLLNPAPKPSFFEGLRGVYGDRPPQSPEEQAAAAARRAEQKAAKAARDAEAEAKRQEKKRVREEKERAKEEEKAAKKQARVDARAAKARK